MTARLLLLSLLLAGCAQRDMPVVTLRTYVEVVR